MCSDASCDMVIFDKSNEKYANALENSTNEWEINHHKISLFINVELTVNDTCCIFFIFLYESVIQEHAT